MTPAPTDSTASSQQQQPQHTRNWNKKSQLQQLKSQKQQNEDIAGIFQNRNRDASVVGNDNNKKNSIPPPPQRRNNQLSFMGDDDDEEEAAIIIRKQKPDRKRKKQTHQEQQEKPIANLQQKNRGNASAKFNVDSIKKHIASVMASKQQKQMESDTIKSSPSMQRAPSPEESEEESEYETDSDESEESSDEEEEMLRPVFISKKERSTIETEEEKIQKQIKREEEQQLREEEKKLDSKAMVAKILVQREMRAERAREEAAKKEGAAHNDDENIPDDDDNLNPEEELELWKEREIARLCEEYRRMKIRKKEKEMLDRRRKMTDEEIMEENERLGIKQGRDKGDWAFLQKYYHQGAFFQEQDESGKFKQDIFNRDILPTNTEKVDKSALPKVMQKRDFGKKSQSKWTHLVDQDTTDFSYGYGSKESFGHDRSKRYQEQKYNGGLARSSNKRQKR